MFGYKKKQIDFPTHQELIILKDEAPERKKYKLLEPEIKICPFNSKLQVFRIQALIDIPMHGVKAGDLGGFVMNENVLDHEGSCWVGGNAIAGTPYPYRERYYESAKFVTENALVTDEAFSRGGIGGNAKVFGNANVTADIAAESSISGNARLHGSKVVGTLILRGNAHLSNVTIYGSLKEVIFIEGDITVVGASGQDFIVSSNKAISIKGKSSMNNVTIRDEFTFDAEVNLEGVSFQGDNTILGKPRIKPDVKFTGRNVISGDSLIPPGSHVHDVTMDSGVLQYGIPQSIDSNVAMPGLPAAAPVSVSNIDITEYIEIIEQIEADYEAYTTDIVKLIKYPGMVDPSIPEVGEFVVHLRSAKRSVKSGRAERVKDMAEVLESSFVRAESKVRTLVSSHLDEGKKKSLKTAEKMFKLACDEASPEPEKRLGFKAGMRSLEGVIDVSDQAVENLKERIGILELEA